MSFQLLRTKWQSGLRATVSSSRRRHLSTLNKLVVSTRSRHQISSHDKTVPDKGAFSVPLTVADVHLRQEQLPFAYYFHEKLDPKLLTSSLSRVLKQFPVVGGRINPETFQAIDCSPCDSIPLSLGDVDISLEEWLSESRGHTYVAGNGHPVLLPLFDPLFESDSNDGFDDNNENKPTNKSTVQPYDNLLKIRVTYFACGSTAIGVNFLHLLGDTASCVRFVQCWGREMQRLSYPRGACNVRANANVSGMMTEDLAELMGLSHELQQRKKAVEGAPSWLDSFGFSEWLSSGDEPEDHSRGESVKDARHEYVQLYFPAEVLTAMKDVGMAPNSDRQEDLQHSFVSTNDLVTAFGWLLKRGLSGEHSWNISMVVNMRGRCGVDSFPNMDGSPTVDGSPTENSGQLPADVEGLFGNGITNVVATHPSTMQCFGIWDVVQAAKSVRLALEEGISQLPHRLLLSRMGQVSQHVSTAESFPTTSWSQFRLKDISFTTDKSLAAFHGHPSHPLPEGQSTYASVIVKTPKRHGPASDEHARARKSGIKYNLLLPSDKVREANQKHQELCEAFLGAQIELRTKVLAA